MMRGLILAVQFLTRIPTPQVRDFRADDLSRAAKWFPLVGLLIGALVALALAALAPIDPWIGALAGLIVWVWITGALHLDGLGDMAAALGASHRDPARFTEVLKDPHKGTFGVVVIVIAILAKFVLLARVDPWAIVLIAAWARLGTLAWSLWIAPLATNAAENSSDVSDAGNANNAGSGERFAWQIRAHHIGFWALALMALSAWLAPPLLLAPVAIAAYGVWLKRRLGGMTGDCLGAGVEIVEVTLLSIAILVPL